MTYFTPFFGHIPGYYHIVFTRRKQLLRNVGEDQRRHFVSDFQIIIQLNLNKRIVK